jgi:hypothetical protein
VANGCNAASTAAAVHDALHGSTAITTRRDWFFSHRVVFLLALDEDE